MHKKNRIAVVLFGVASGCTWAQSSVTLFGVVDAAVERVKGAGSSVRIASGQQQGSRWGLRGVEELGGGLKAVFHLESGFNVHSGQLAQGGRLFGRQAFVGLTGGWGGIRLGRQYTPMDEVAAVVGTKTYDVLSVVPVIGNGDYNRVDSAITYLSPSWGGTSMQLQYSFGAGRLPSDSSSQFQKQASLHVMHTQGALTAGLGLMRVLDADGTQAGKQPVNAALLTASYDFGAVRLSAYYDVEDKAIEKLKVYGLAAGIPLGNATVSVGVAQARNVTGAIGRDDATLYTLQGGYNLSKRTALYAHYTLVDNKGAAALGFNGPVAGNRSSGLQVGLRHRF